jgi:DNA-binding CsgD family transcriptional regulator
MQTIQNIKNAVAYSVAHWYLGGPAFAIALFFFVHFRLGMVRVVGSLTFPDLCFLASSVFLLLLIGATFLARLAERQHLLLIISTLCGTLCFLCIGLPAVLGVPLGIFGLLGAVLFSVFIITNWLLWFQIISHLPILVTAIIITVSIALASLFVWYLVGLDTYRLLWGLLLLVALAALTAFRALREQAEPLSLKAVDKTEQNPDARFPVGFLVVTFCFSLAFMFTTSLTGLEAFHSNFNWDLAVFALLLLAGMLLLPKRISIAVLFSIAAPATIASILFSLIPGVVVAVPASLYNLGFFIYLVFVITLFCGIAQELRGDSSRLACFLILSFYVGCFVGRGLYPAIEFLFAGDVEYYRTILATAIILVLVICTTLCLRVIYRISGNEAHDSPFDFVGLPQHEGLSFEQASELFDLSEREAEVLELMLEGKTAAQIAEAMVIAHGTAKAHIGNVYKKLDIHNRGELFKLISKD